MDHAGLAGSGPYALGRTVLPLVDRSRTDPWVPSADGRELMVTLHYPAARPGGGRPAPYATAEEARLLAEQLGPGVSGEVLARTRTHSRTDARPAPGRHPLVLLSPGFGVSRWTLTHLAEDLASRGYVVASVDHAYESYGESVFPAAAPSPVSPATPSTRAVCTPAWSPRPAPPTSATSWTGSPAPVPSVGTPT